MSAIAFRKVHERLDYVSPRAVPHDAVQQKPGASLARTG
jgi:hypothetical protein